MAPRFSFNMDFNMDLTSSVNVPTWNLAWDSQAEAESHTWEAEGAAAFNGKVPL
jgi:hypothetical protein